MASSLHWRTTQISADDGSLAWRWLFSFSWVLVPSLFLFSPEGGLWCFPAPWDAGGWWWILAFIVKMEVAIMVTRSWALMCGRSPVHREADSSDRMACQTHRVLSAGSTPLGEFGPGLGSSIWRGLQNQEPGSCPDRIPGRLLGTLTILASILAGHRQRVGFSCFLFSDLSPSRGPQTWIKTRNSWRVGGKKLFLIHSSGRVWRAPFLKWPVSCIYLKISPISPISEGLLGVSPSYNSLPLPRTYVKGFVRDVCLLLSTLHFQKQEVMIWDPNYYVSWWNFGILKYN